MEITEAESGMRVAFSIDCKRCLEKRVISVQVVSAYLGREAVWAQSVDESDDDDGVGDVWKATKWP